MTSSIFSDFEKAWAQRFPTCELPKAWEEDVRQNLDKHRLKVHVLKEELEKEEFYVQYLERLLADVERVKSKSDLTKVIKTETETNENESNKVNNINNGDQYVTVISVSSYGEIQRPAKSLIDNPLYQTNAQSLSVDQMLNAGQSNHQNSSSITSSEATNFDQQNSSTEVLIQNQVSKKKRPPTPPRKPKVNKLPSLQLMDKKDFYTSFSEPNTPDVDQNNLLITKSNINQNNEFIEINKTFKETNCENDETLYDDDVNNIYDTVAPDYEPQIASQVISSKQINSDFCDPNSSNDNLSKYFDSNTYNTYANYVNIDYFLRKDETSSRDDSDDNETHISQSLSSDHENDENGRDLELNKGDISLINECEKDSITSLTKTDSFAATYDDVFESNLGNVNDLLTNESEAKNSSFSSKNERINNLEAERLTMYKCIIASITESETVYVDCLNTLIQYMKALKSTIGTTHPLLTSEELSTIFYKIPELYSIHWSFLDGMKKLSNSNDSKDHQISSIGDLFKVLASRLGAYSAFLKNYSKALETIHKCSATNNQFSEITRSIKIVSLKGQSTTLEDLLHKPVARVQKNALVLHDLLKYTNEELTEYKSLKTALKMTQCFLNDLNIAATEQMFPTQDKTQRRLVKESFIVESNDDKRKLRHLFLFNDVIVCAKYKASAKQKFTFDLKWYNLLNEISITETECETQSSLKDKENNNHILNIKSRVSNTRDLISREEKEKSKSNTKLLDKLKKKRSELEAQLVLLLPQLKFCISHKSGKIYTFYLSSDFERSQWIESIKVLQQSANYSNDAINFNELQAWIETCRKNLNPNLGSFLLRSSKDEDLLFGDLYLTVHHLKGLSREADIFFILELDTYGHYIQRAITHVSKQSLEPNFEQEFVLDLEGTQSIRILCYEEISGQQKPFFRGKTSLELSQTWLNDNQTQQFVPILDCVLTLSLRYVSSQSNTARFPAAKVCGSFGVNVQQVCKKEKSTVPYLILSCIREVERRGMKEVGIYRVSGLSSDVQRLKKAFETNTYEADLLMKEIDIHAVTGLLKLYLRELPESLFTNAMYKKYFDAFNITNQSEKSKRLLALFSVLTQPNQNIIIVLIDHLNKVNQFEEHNKMSLHNLATVFGPTVLRPGTTATSGTNSIADSFTLGTIDVMAQAGILYFFLRRKASGLSLINTNCETSC